MKKILIAVGAVLAALAMIGKAAEKREANNADPADKK